MRRRLFFGLGLTAILGALSSASCLSPTLPLPPPDVESVTPSQQSPGTWIISGTCSPGALVTVLNDETGKGAVFEDREQVGQWTVILQAEECDEAWVSQERDTDGSSRTFFTIEAQSAGEPTSDTVCK